MYFLGGFCKADSCQNEGSDSGDVIPRPHQVPGESGRNYFWGRYSSIFMAKTGLPHASSKFVFAHPPPGGATLYIEFSGSPNTICW